jgi:hypothetical protein
VVAAITRAIADWADRHAFYGRFILMVIVGSDVISPHGAMNQAVVNVYHCVELFGYIDVM